MLLSPICCKKPAEENLFYIKMSSDWDWDWDWGLGLGTGIGEWGIENTPVPGDDSIMPGATIHPPPPTFFNHEGMR